MARIPDYQEVTFRDVEELKAKRPSPPTAHGSTREGVTPPRGNGREQTGAVAISASAIPPPPEVEVCVAQAEERVHDAPHRTEQADER
jgi:hypothetical protein